MAAAPTTAVIAEGPTLADLFDHIAYSNPFAQDRISDPAEADVDVMSIHHRQFTALVEHAEHAKRDGRGIGVVLWGEAGVGKSHLLARFSRWAESDYRACYVFLHNIHVDAERLPRYIGKSVVSRLTSGRSRAFRGSRLYMLLRQIVEKAVDKYSDAPARKHTRSELLAFFERALGEHLRNRPRPADVDDETIYRVLFEFFVSAHQAARKKNDERTAAAAVRWLSGDQLDDEDIERLAVRAEDGGALRVLQDNHAVERVLIALMELCRMEDQAFILVFDQVENLDAAEVRALSRFSQTLLDHASNLLLVTSGVQRELLDYVEAGTIGESSWGRIRQDDLRLDLITPNEARQLLEVRLEKFLESFVTIRQVKERLSGDTLFPLGEEWLHGQVGDALSLKPRHVIGWARQRWREQVAALKDLGGDVWLKRWPQTGRVIDDCRPLKEIIDETIEEKIREQVHRRELDPGSLPPDAANLCGLVEALLLQCKDAGRDYTFLDLTHPRGRKTQKPTYDLVVRERSPNGSEVATGLAFVVTGSKTSATGSLRRIAADPNPPEHVIAVSDERQPLECGKTGKDHQEKLTARGSERYHEMELPFLQYAQLDALEAVIGEARSGDLEVMLPEGMRQLSEEDVIESHHRQDRYRKHPLLNELLCEEAVVSPPPPPTRPEPEIRQFIAAQLALTMGMSSVELAQKYHARYAGDGRAAVAAIKERLEQVALEMHHDEQINATPMGDYLYLLNRPGR